MPSVPTANFHAVPVPVLPPLDVEDESELEDDQLVELGVNLVDAFDCMRNEDVWMAGPEPVAVDNPSPSVFDAAHAILATLNDNELSVDSLELLLDGVLLDFLCDALADVDAMSFTDEDNNNRDTVMRIHPPLPGEPSFSLREFLYSFEKLRLVHA